MKNKNKNVAWATFRTATQVVAIMAVILVTLIACGKSDSGGSTDNKNLIGTWKLESMTIDGKNVEDIVFDDGEKISKASKKCFYRTSFTFLEKEGVFSNCALGTLKNNECKCESVSFIYTVSGNTIVLKSTTGEAESMSIVGNKLTLSASKEDEKGNKHIYTMTFVKQ